jgi:hypothetical protein
LQRGQTWKQKMLLLLWKPLYVISDNVFNRFMLSNQQSPKYYLIIVIYHLRVTLNVKHSVNVFSLSLSQRNHIKDFTLYYFFYNGKPHSDVVFFSMQIYSVVVQKTSNPQPLGCKSCLIAFYFKFYWIRTSGGSNLKVS